MKESEVSALTVVWFRLYIKNRMEILENKIRYMIKIIIPHIEKCMMFNYQPVKRVPFLSFTKNKI